MEYRPLIFRHHYCYTLFNIFHILQGNWTLVILSIKSFWCVLKRSSQPLLNIDCLIFKPLRLPLPSDPLIAKDITAVSYVPNSSLFVCLLVCFLKVKVLHGSAQPRNVETCRFNVAAWHAQSRSYRGLILLNNTSHYRLNQDTRLIIFEILGNWCEAKNHNAFHLHLVSWHACMLKRVVQGICMHRRLGGCQWG